MELTMAKKEIRRTDAEAEHRGKIAGLFCKAFERAVLLTPTEENVRLWVEGTRMRPDEIEDSIKEAYELATSRSALSNASSMSLSTNSRWVSLCPVRADSRSRWALMR